MTADIVVIAAYMVIINVIGIMFSKVKTIDDYFLGDRKIPWPAACFSIVATETSTLTFISIPGLAYITGLGFLQVAFGYLAGRVLVAVVLLPGYFRGDISTAYEFIQKKFGIDSRRIIAVIFHITRLLADSVRLFATAIPLSFLTGLEYWQSVLIIGIATFIYTFYGGIRSVVIVDSIQLFLYLFCAVAGIYIITGLTGKSFFTIMGDLPEGSLRIFSTGLSGGLRGILGSYNVFSGIIGGALLSFASHGTDHLMVQRVLSCRDLGSARKAMVASGVIVIIQFMLFMTLGLFIKALMKGETFPMPDAIMPHFIVKYLPPGMKGLMLAGIFAAAMSTLSSSINALASSTALDIAGISRRGYSEKKKLLLSRGTTLLWTAVIILMSSLLSDNKSPLVEVGLAIASVTYGGMLGIFILGVTVRGVSEKAALAGVIISIVSVIVMAAALDVFWPWYVPAGFIISYAVGLALHRWNGRRN